MTDPKDVVIITAAEKEVQIISADFPTFNNEFNPDQLRDADGKFGSGGAGSGGGVSGDKANGLSEKANKSGHADDHTMAARAHKNGGNKKLAFEHASKAAKINATDAEHHSSAALSQGSYIRHQQAGFTHFEAQTNHEIASETAHSESDHKFHKEQAEKHRGLANQHFTIGRSMVSDKSAVASSKKANNLDTPEAHKAAHEANKELADHYSKAVEYHETSAKTAAPGNHRGGAGYHEDMAKFYKPNAEKFGKKAAMHAKKMK